MGADGICHTHDGLTTIYLDPNGSRTVEVTTLHELTHALKGGEGWDLLQKEALKYYTDNKAKAEDIKTQYVNFYKANNLEFTEDTLNEELTAHYVEQRLSNRNYLSKLVETEPTFIQKCIERIKKWAGYYTNTEDTVAMQILQNRFSSVYNMRKNMGVAKKSSIRFIIKSYNPTETELSENIEYVAQMQPVSYLSGTEFQKGEKRLDEQVESFFNSIGNNAYNKELGDVELSKRGAKDSIGHGIGRAKASGFKAVPEIISNGRILNYERNWKERGYDTAVIAAPIAIGTDRYYALVVVKRDVLSQRFYIHELMIENEKTIKESALFKTETNARERDGNLGKALPLYTIFQKLLNVNSKTEKSVEKYSLAVFTADSQGKATLNEEKVKLSLRDSKNRTLSQSQQEYFANSKVRDTNGNLLVVYHGSPNNFTVFESKSGLYWFTPSKNYAKFYIETQDITKVKEYYINVEKMLDVGNVDSKAVTTTGKPTYALKRLADSLSTTTDEATKRSRFR